jgi:hypothetical protein
MVDAKKDVPAAAAVVEVVPPKPPKTEAQLAFDTVEGKWDRWFFFFLLLLFGFYI